jgi:NAD+ synthase (glutamine-hydrolysing)
MIVLNGRIIAQGSQFSLNDVEVVSATIDIEDVRAHRAKGSRSMQATAFERYHRIEVDFALSGGKLEVDMMGLGMKTEVKYHIPEEEIAYVLFRPPHHSLPLIFPYSLSPACWLWDYLRRSRTQGYFIPLSGGIDSCATAVIVFSMCRLVAEAARRAGTYADSSTQI